MFRSFLIRAIPVPILFSASLAPAGAAVYPTGSSINSDVTLAIVANCVISALPLNFGTNQGVLTSAVNVNTTLAVTCSNATPYNIGLSAGSGAGSSTTIPYMRGTGSNTATVQFSLFQTAGASNWGNTQGTDTLSGVGNDQSQSLTVYGQIPVQNTPVPEPYKATVTATVSF